MQLKHRALGQMQGNYRYRCKEINLERAQLVNHFSLLLLNMIYGILINSFLLFHYFAFGRGRIDHFTDLQKKKKMSQNIKFLCKLIGRIAHEGTE